MAPPCANAPARRPTPAPLAHDPMVLPHLQVGGIQPHVRVIAFRRTLAKGTHGLIQLFKGTANLALVDAGKPQPLEQMIHLARAHALHIRALHDGQQSLLCLAAGLQGGKADALP